MTSSTVDYKVLAEIHSQFEEDKSYDQLEKIGKSYKFGQIN